jgi:NAD(P)-dependent dehydrogenase (short-subunit alcohol dehydrogenase family)
MQIPSETLAGRTIMITGGSRGLGSALATAFASAGANVSVCARSEVALRELRQTLPPASSIVHEADVTSVAEVARWTELTRHSFGPIYALINNASILGTRVPLRTYPVEEWRAVIDVNLTGTFVVSREVLPEMVERGSGSIINVSSGAAIPPRPDWGAYAVSKAALDAYTLNLASELEGSGVSVSLVDPGSMRTSMRAEAYPDEDPRRPKPPAAIAPLFLWLATSPPGAHGQRYRADEWLASRGGGG